MMDAKIGETVVTPINNGGTTGYYDLPLPDRSKVEEIVLKLQRDQANYDSITNEILELCPQTLNDLIEFKNMQPWMHEVFKACYALNERATKNGGSRIREINKILYYANRGLQIELTK
jgi:hypothetical protein